VVVLWVVVPLLEVEVELLDVTPPLVVVVVWVVVPLLEVEVVWTVELPPLEVVTTVV
jgi:hypothetical protein